ncbi:MAG: integrase core domain-containing protein [Nitrospira sp.]|nr:integrase core domain-containing protein [Nitrospira sp.]
MSSTSSSCWPTNVARSFIINVTDHPTAQWTAQQVIEAFPFETAPRYLLHDRDGIYGNEFQRRVARMGIEQVCTAPRSPWQNPYVERLIGSVRRECIDHLIIFDEHHLHRVLRNYLAYYHKCRTHLSLKKDAPEGRVPESADMTSI